MLNSLGLQIKDHWREFLPRLYRELEQAGRLDESVYAAQERTADAFADLVQRGMAPDAAWEAIREEWAFRPAEADGEREPEDER